MTGLIIKHTGSNYTVRNQETGTNINCGVKGKLRLKGLKTTNPIAVGDQVVFEPVAEGEGVISQVLPRKNYIVRRSSNLSRQAHVLAANIDKAFLITTIVYPRTSFEFIDRFLVTAEAYNIPACLVVNKTDLYTSAELRDELEYFRKVYRSAGYEIIETSAIEHRGIETIRKMIPGRISLLAGNSGVGKSSIINALNPALKLRTGEISQAHNKGTHTTTFYEMFELCEGFVIDSPGIKGFGLIDMDRNEIYHFFPEIFKAAADCRFNMCTHTCEPGCAVKQAVEDSIISESRYISYLKILEDDEDKYR
ncbi:MAG: ribosome small subunit-dependent GTPase A [Prevotellaceae bacterium]|jgi:ribosome biogenesis GTPase|nr:ribosome small subunit-dependent GTPase A [Prevotellaceae bacterium]